MSISMITNAIGLLEMKKNNNNLYNTVKTRKIDHLPWI